MSYRRPRLAAWALTLAFIVIRCAGAPGESTDNAVDAQIDAPDLSVLDVSDDALEDSLFPSDMAEDGDVDGTQADIPDVADVPPGPCQRDADCVARLGDLAPCERAVCDERHGTCLVIRAPDGAACDDGDACTSASICLDGRCLGRELACDDDISCTLDYCDPAEGCVHEARSGACDDGDPCTSDDQCADGECVGTAGACPCAIDADCAEFEDDDACTGALVCQDDGCRIDRAATVVCPPSANPCEVARCDPATGGCDQVALPDGHPCDDGDACTRLDSCQTGRCRAGIALLCDDGNPCTSDRCDATHGCVATPTQSTCDDNDGCTEGDRCEGARCRPGAVNDCFDETCVPAWPLFCDTDDAWWRDGDGATDLVLDYAAGPTGLDGPEVTYALVAPFDGRATLQLLDADEGVSAVVLEAARRGCDPLATRVVSPPATSFALSEDAVYYVVVDGPKGAALDFRLQLECQPRAEQECADSRDDDGDGLTDCEDGDCADDLACLPPTTGAEVWALRCGDRLPGRTYGPGAERRRESYCCAEGGPDLDGPERRYHFVAPAAASYTIGATGTTAPVDLIVLPAEGRACVDRLCRARGAGAVTFVAAAGEALELVVDTVQPAGASYELVVECPASLESTCDDGTDEDGDGATDCDDDDCRVAPGCLVGTCPETPVLGCGERVSGVSNGPGSTQGIASYACSLFRFESAERIYRVEAPAGATVVAQLEEGPEELDVFLLSTATDEGCGGERCVSWGADRAQASQPVSRELYAVVDGYGETGAAFTLSIDCLTSQESVCDDGRDEDGDGLTDCADDACRGTAACPSCDAAVTATLECGDEVPLSTRAPVATDLVDGYGCNANVYDGPERLYAFRLELGGIVTFLLESEDGPLDLMLLDDLGNGCDPRACNRTSPYRVRQRLAGDRTYYVAVDGYDGGTGAGLLRVICEGRR